ncbi:MAG: segregation and condensation protein [Bacillota bacterium]|nr:segregation and condensation protein [Bacillota bacterium]MDK2959929.1 segregation and condensation protein [Bacillota bacterium]
MGYEIRLENFTGPFDLLCHLIKEAKLDICAVSLAQVVDQYLAYVEAAAGQADLDAAGDFLVMAARLLVLKARVLLPSSQPASEGGEEEDPEQLVDHLREYKIFRDAAAKLAGLMEKEADYFPAPGLSSADVGATKADLPDVNIDPAALAAAWAKMAPLFRPPPPVTIIPDRPTVQEEIKRLMRRLRQVPALEFRQYVGRRARPTRLVPAFLAVLELWHREKVRVWQAVRFGEIIIARREDGQCTASR